MIEMHQTLVTSTGTGSRGSLWRASCVVDGVEYEASSRSGAPAALARKLVEAEIPDQPVKVTSDAMSGTEIRRLPGYMAYSSLHKMAGFTMEEGAASPLHRVRWRDAPEVWRSPKNDG